MVGVFMALIVDDKIQCDLQHCKCADNSSVVIVTFSHTSDVSIEQDYPQNHFPVQTWIICQGDILLYNWKIIVSHLNALQTAISESEIMH